MMKELSIEDVSNFQIDSAQDGWLSSIPGRHGEYSLIENSFQFQKERPFSDREELRITGK